VKAIADLQAQQEPHLLHRVGYVLFDIATFGFDL